MVDRLGELGKANLPKGAGARGAGYSTLHGPGSEKESLVYKEATNPRNDLEMGVVADSKFMAEYFEDVEKIKSKMHSIRDNTKLIAQKHQEALTAVTIDKGDTTKRNQLDDLMMQTTGLGQEVRGLLKKLDKSYQDLNQNPAYASSAESRIRGNLQSVLSRKFMETMSEYNDCQQKYKSLYQEKAKRQYLIVKPNATDAEVEQVISGESKSVFADSMMSGGQQALNEMQDRHKDIVKLENSIRELHQLFVDMATMVDSQGELLDVIEHNVAEGLDYVKKGTGELVKAREYQRSANKKKLMIGACCVILLLVIILPILKSVGVI